MKKFMPFLILYTFLTISVQANDLAKFYQDVDNFLKKYSSGGMVSYSEIAKNFSEIESIYNNIGSVDLTKVSQSDKKAFYINAYNMIVIYQVSKFYPLKSALDQSGFFDQVKHKVAGELITLNALEIVKLLRVHKDARIHFTLACAAKGCPKLANFAYMPNQLDKQLHSRTSLSLNDQYFVRLDKTKQVAKISMIFKWYQKDFNTQGKNTLSFINDYRKIKIPENFKIEHYKYDWSLNSK